MVSNVSPFMEWLLVLANVINVVYNIPQMVHTYKTKSTKDFSIWFITLRIFGNIIWVLYAIEVNSILMLVNNTVTVLSSIFIGYYKAMHYYEERKQHQIPNGNQIVPMEDATSNY